MTVILPETPTKTIRPQWDTGPSRHDSSNNETLLIRLISRFFRRWAYFISDHAFLVIVICSILSAIGAAKMATTPNENDITGWTPYGARSLTELAISKEFFGQEGQTIAVLLLLVDKDGESILTTKHLKEAKKIEDFISTNFTMMNYKSGKRENYRDFCYSFCQINEPLVQFANGYMIQESAIGDRVPFNERIDLQYPVSYMYGRKLNIQPNLFGVETFNDTVSEETSNSTALLGQRRFTNIKSAKMLAVQLRAEVTAGTGWTAHDIKVFEQSVTDYFRFQYHSENFIVHSLSTTYVENEVVRAGYLMLPIFIIGFGIMLAVSSVTTFMSAAYMQQLSIHKFSLALFACICPFMACGTALGFMFLFGIRFGSILCISPFLVLAIGVDDAYLMIHTWQRVSKRLRNHPEQDDCPAYRLAEVLTDTGPAIIISALTNILADLVGTFTGCPEVTLLSYGNMACMSVDFLYQISFYAAIMAIAGKYEIANEKQERNKLSIEIGDDNSVNMGECCPKTSESFHNAVKNKFNTFLDSYVNLVNNKLFDVVVFVIWAGYIVMCIYGITLMRVNLSPKKLFAGDSQLLAMEDLRTEYVYPHFTLAQIFVNNPGDLSDPKRLARLNEFVDKFEHLPGAWGANSSNYFLRDFLDYEKFSHDMSAEELEGSEGINETHTTSLSPFSGNSTEIPITMNDLQSFIEWPEYEFWRGFIRTSQDENNNTKLEKFFFTTAFRGDEYLSWSTRSQALKTWRALIDEYKPEFNCSILYDEAVYIDLVDNMPTDTWQSAVGTLSCMALICFVFMFDLFTVSVATMAIASIMAGILGLNGLGGMELDPIVMASLVISVGFSVDIPAHVSYHFHMAGAHLPPPLTVKRRLRFCLGSVGFPAVQAAISTNLCVVALLFADIYTSRVFVKVMVSCVSLCLVHGLLIIPCAMSLLSPIIDWVRGTKHQ